jgi:hypothetical protein
MSTSSPGSSSVKVSTDGVKIGWTILAVGASIGLGLYIATIVTPIKKDLDTLMSNTSTCQKGLMELSNSFIQHNAASAEKITQLRAEQDKLCDRMKACEYIHSHQQQKDYK